MQKRILAVVALIAVAGLTGCTSASDAAGSGSAVAGPKAGIARLTVGGKAQDLSLQLCVKTGVSGVNVTAIGSQKPASQLTVNMVKPVTASTLVFTNMKADNSYTIYSMGSGGKSTSGVVTGSHVVIQGIAAEQAYDKTGKAVGKPTSGAVSLNATCRVVQPQQPAASFAPQKK
jgi:hypothetical protein